MEEEPEDFIREFKKKKSCKNTEIEFIIAGCEFHERLLRYSECTMPDRDSFGSEVKQWKDNIISFVGYYDEKKVYMGKKIEGYEFQTAKLFEVCSCCFNEEFYNEKKGEWYCPHCLEHRPWHYRLSEWKEKAISYLSERIKQ